MFELLSIGCGAQMRDDAKMFDLICNGQQVMTGARGNFSYAIQARASVNSKQRFRCKAWSRASESSY
jgi:phosphoribosylformylglycinamidine (FGAM) synthase-like amidotransferase family enzyme